VKRDARRDHSPTATAKQKCVEAPVEHDQERENGSGGSELPPCKHGEQHDRRAGPNTMTPTEVQGGRARVVFEHQPQPRHATPEQISLCNARKRPALQMLPLNRRVEEDAATVSTEAHAELDILDRREREPFLVEAANLDECVAANGSQPGPEGGRESGAFVVHMMVEQVAKVRHDPSAARIVIVGSEDCRQLRVVLEQRPDPNKSVGVHLDIGVNEDQHIAVRAPRTEVPSGSWAEVGRLVDDDHLLRRRSGARHRLQDAAERRPPVSRWDHDAECDRLDHVCKSRSGSAAPNGASYAPRGHTVMAERARLSEERLKLIRSFMGEPAGESEVPVQALDSGVASPRPRPSPPVPARVSPARRRTWSHRARAWSQRKPSTGLGPFLRHHSTLRWPIVAVLLGLIIGLLIARTA
jgi:hypothetical protein